MFRIVVIFGLCWMIVAVLGLVRASAATPSFDCDGAKTEVERLICTDDELAALDVKLAKMFASALAKAPADAVTALKASQKAWPRSLKSSPQGVLVPWANTSNWCLVGW